MGGDIWSFLTKIFVPRVGNLKKNVAKCQMPHICPAAPPSGLKLIGSLGEQQSYKWVILWSTGNNYVVIVVLAARVRSMYDSLKCWVIFIHFSPILDHIPKKNQEVFLTCYIEYKSFTHIVSTFKSVFWVPTFYWHWEEF